MELDVYHRAGYVSTLALARWELTHSRMNLPATFVKRYQVMTRYSKNAANMCDDSFDQWGLEDSTRCWYNPCIGRER